MLNLYYRTMHAKAWSVFFFLWSDVYVDTCRGAVRAWRWWLPFSRRPMMVVTHVCHAVYSLLERGAHATNALSPPMAANGKYPTTPHPPVRPSVRDPPCLLLSVAWCARLAGGSCTPCLICDVPTVWLH